MYDQSNVDVVVEKLLVVEAWDEPTSSNPRGKHGDASLFYEGKAAQLALTYSNNSLTIPPNVIKDDAENTRLEQLAICTGFQYVSKLKSDSSIEVAVGEKRSSGDQGRKVKKVSLDSRESAEKGAMINAMTRLGIYTYNYMLNIKIDFIHSHRNCNLKAFEAIQKKSFFMFYEF